MSTPKRQRTSNTSIGKSSAQKTLCAMREAKNAVDAAASFKALCSCVVSAASSNSPDDYKCLMDLLKAGGDPNFNSPEILERTGGFPLHLAIKLNVPRAVEILLAKGASVVQVYEDKTALHVRLRFQCSDGYISLIVYAACL